MHRPALAALAAVMWGIGAAPVFAENRVALVIGNGAYQHAPRLTNPTNDATDVATALKRSGFDCAKHDSDCHVIAIGPFTVQPN